MTATLERPDEELIAAALPPDPLAHIKVGDQVTHEDLRIYLLPDGTQGQGRRLCEAEYHDIGYCQRAPHPEHWDHIICANGERSGAVRWRWSTYDGTGFPELPAQTDDSAEEVNVNEIEGLMRFRNRRDLLLVIGRTDENAKTFDVLDLTHQRFRRIQEDKLVQRKPTDPMPTPDEMAWAAKWLSKSKNSVLAVARREVRSSRWDVATMTRSLKKMDIVPPPPKWSGSVSVTLNFDLAQPGLTSGPTRMELRGKLQALLDGLGNDEIKNLKVSTSDIPSYTQS